MSWDASACWQCGANAAREHQGKMLCRRCWTEFNEPPKLGETPIANVRRLYWEAHALERCWRCMNRPVPPDDDLGLCESCRRAPVEVLA